MEEVKTQKAIFERAFNALPEDRREEIKTFYSVGGAMGLIIKARHEALQLADYADYKGYGIGEMGYFINERASEFGEDVPELKSQYRALVSAYLDFTSEANSI